MTARRTDANQAEIVEALRMAGRKVQDLHGVGRGCPDLLVLCPSGALVLLEVKTPAGKLNERERDWLLEWDGAAAFVVRTVEEAIRCSY